MTDLDRSTSTASAADADRAGRRLKAGGVFLAVIGLFLVALMGTIAWRMAPMLLVAPAATADGSHFNASPGAAQLVLALFGSVMLFGAIALWMGLRQAATGTRPRRLLYLLWGAGALILAMTLVVVLAIKQGQA